MSYTVPDQFQDLLNAARAVGDRWESGDLAEAVRNLSSLVEDIDAEGEELEEIGAALSCEHCPAEGGPCIVCKPQAKLSPAELTADYPDAAGLAVVVVEVEYGAATVHACPPGVCCVVKDYDVEGANRELDTIEQDNRGEYIRTVWTPADCEELPK
jgi:hypothetical protein